MEIEKLSGQYIRGYTKAIMDIQEVFDYVEHDLTHHKKRMNGKLAKELLSCILQNRSNIRDRLKGFVRWNCITQKFEWFNGNN